MYKDKSTRLIANWILLGIAMLIVQVLIGGITRLTGSGLSITEWKPIMGFMPPMNDNQWQHAFAQYQQIAQFKYINQHFTIADFKFIFFWEWFHRLWARLIVLAFVFPFAYFIAKRYFKSWMVAPLVILFLMGAMQGAIGWIMVKSGLNDNDVYVNHIKLATHFVAAMALISYAWVFCLKLKTERSSIVYDRGLYKLAIALTCLLTIQLMYGAFMAGLKAASAAPTWPSINGAILPAAAPGGWLHAAFYDKIVIHFIHRTLAYVVLAGVLVWWFKGRSIRYSTGFTKVRTGVLLLVLLQVLLGIVTVLASPHIVPGHFGLFETLAEMHQLTGMLLLLSLVAAIYFTTGKKRAHYA